MKQHPTYTDDTFYQVEWIGKTWRYTPSLPGASVAYGGMKNPHRKKWARLGSPYRTSAGAEDAIRVKAASLRDYLGRFPLDHIRFRIVPYHRGLQVCEVTATAVLREGQS